MSFKEFGEVVSESSPSFKEFGEIIETSPGSPMKEVGKQAGIGAVRGLGTYGNLLDLIGAQIKNRLLPGHQALTQAEFQAPPEKLGFFQDEDIMPRYSRLPTGEEAEQLLQQLGAETQPKTPAGKTARRVTEGAVGSATLLPTPLAVSAGGAGGAVGGLTEELTGSPLAGDVAEIATNISAFMKGGPQAVGKRAQRLSNLKDLGFSPKEATLLSQGEGKLNFLGKLASKDKKMTNLFKKIYDTHSNLYDGLRDASKDFGFLRGKNLEKLDENLISLMDKLTPGQRKLAEKTIDDFRSKPVSFKSMMDLIHDLNDKFGRVTGGRKAVLTLKSPILEGMKDLNPEAATIFNDLQSSYKNFKTIAKQLKPKHLDTILDASEMLTFAKGLIEAKGGLLVKTLGLTGARKLAREFLINPELQGLVIRYAKATEMGKTNVAQALARQIQKRMPKDTSKPQQETPQ